MFDKNYFREYLPLLVQGYGGYAVVRLLTYSNDDYLVRGVIKTEDGYGVFEVYLDESGETPIIASSSSVHDFDVSTPFTSKAVSLPYENIADVQVRAAPRQDAIFH